MNHGFLYPTDQWCVREDTLNPELLHQGESLFAVANGYLGLRGTFEQGNPVFQNGTYINGFFEYRPIHYGEEAYGYAKSSQTILNLTDCKVIKLSINGEPLDLLNQNISEYIRTLDMKQGLLTCKFIWHTTSGIDVQVITKRFVSLHRKHIAAIQYSVQLLNTEAKVTLSSEMVSNESNQLNEWDPRETAHLYGQVLIPESNYCSGQSLFSSHTTKNSQLNLSCMVDHQLHTNCKYRHQSHSTDALSKVIYDMDCKPGSTLTLTKFMAYHSGHVNQKHSLEDAANESIDSAMSAGFDLLLIEHRKHWEQYWKETDIQIEGDDRAQQGLRFSLFHIYQSVGKSGERGISAKGLTGQGYEGHYFWDTEIYVIPTLLYTQPEIAKNLLIVRHSMLQHAKEHAKTLSQKGALFAWRTITGEPASAYFPASTAQYHINADIAYAIKQYVDVTGDRDFLINYGAEILIETARFWVDLGFYNPKKSGKFCINGVTGPDEYTAIVNNNVYTNLMARENLCYAAEILEDHEISEKMGVDREEAKKWRDAADNMYIPYDEETGLFPQDDNFLEKEPWDIASIPKNHFPLLLHYHPLVIYRRQILKQSDLLLAMFILRKYFTEEQVKTNFHYYDPLTTGDSSLSDCIQGIIASQIGEHQKVYEYFQETVEMDLQNINHNVKDGVHIASMAGSWLYVVHGFAGMRQDEGKVSFYPRLPQGWTKLTIPLTVGNCQFTMTITPNETTYTLLKGSKLTIHHREERIILQTLNQEVRTKT
ncbi:MAG: glycosyl hydrolase family 65 protein [Chlamydiota bacterium]